MSLNFSASDSDQSRFELMVDTFHHPYIKFNNSFRFPAIHPGKISSDEKNEVRALLNKQIPFFMPGFSPLPEPKPRKDTNQIHYVKHLTFSKRDYICMLKISAEYMGGASSSEVLKVAQQGVTPEISTDRIYFQCRIVPVVDVSYNGGKIFDFKPMQIKETDFHVTSKDTSRDVWSTILFDQIDFSEVNRKFSNLCSFESEWSGGHLFFPFVIDYLTLCCNVVFPSHRMIDELARKFDLLFSVLYSTGSVETVDEDVKRFWKHYYTSFQYVSELSRSGNPHWKFIKYPDEQWVSNIV